MTAATGAPPTDPPAPSRREMALRVGGAALAGLTGALASEPVGATWTQWVGFVLLLRALDGLSLRRSFLVGWAAGVAANTGLFTWLAVAVHGYGQIPWWAAGGMLVVYLLLTGLQYGALGAADWLGRARAPRARLLLFPLAFVTVELVWPQVFHWTMGVAQVPNLRIAQVAELGGTLLVSYLLMVANAGLDALIAWARRRRAGAAAPFPWAEVGLAVGLLGAALGWGSWRLAAVRERMAQTPSARVAFVQPNVVHKNDDLPGELVQRALEQGAREVAALTADRPPDLTVFSESAAAWPHLEVAPPARPEGAVRTRELEAEARQRLALLGRLAAIAHSPVVVGSPTLRVQAHGPDQVEVTDLRNSLLLIGADGTLRDRYDKHLLLLMGEYLPGEEALPFLRSLFPTAGQFSAGPGSEVVEAGGLRLGPLICYEAVAPAVVRALFRDEPGPRLLINGTNDVWFGRTQGPYLHRMIVRWRPIETRRSLVRVTATGVSAAMLPDGSMVGETPLFAAAVRVIEVPLLDDGPTFYVRHGELFGWLAALAWVLGLAAPALWRRLRSGPGDRPGGEAGPGARAEAPGDR